MPSQKHALARLPRLEGLSRCSHLAKNLKRILSLFIRLTCAEVYCNYLKLCAFFWALEYMAVRRIVCLANSYKFGGLCVAGIELMPNGSFGQWIRPVTNRSSRAINHFEQTCTDGTPSRLLDILDIDFGDALPENHQSENILIKSGKKWKKIGRFPPANLAQILHYGNEPLWPYAKSTASGQNDEIPAGKLPYIKFSLALIRPARAMVRVFQSRYKQKGKLDVRVRFEWGGEPNNLKLTDLQKFSGFQNVGSGEYSLKNPTMCVSVGEIFIPQNAAYKLVAGLIV